MGGTGLAAAARLPMVDQSKSSSSPASETKGSPILESPVGDILFLQRTVGNRAVEDLLRSGESGGQGGTSEPGNVQEREADRIADLVSAAPAHAEAADAPPRIPGVPGPSQGRPDAAPASVDHALPGPGRPLEPAVRQDMEQRFDHDFSQVRVHSDTVAQESAHDMNALAYTMGRNIVFGANGFAPGTQEGKRLLAHELTHVLQQSASGVPALQLKRGPDPKSGDSKRGPDAKSVRPKERTIQVIHARAGSTEGATAFVSGEPEPIPITLTFNALTEGDYILVKRDIRDTALIEYVNEDGSPCGITWKKPPGVHSAERVQVTVGELDYPEFAQAEFDAIDPHLKQRLTKRGGQRLTTPQEKLGFAKFAKELTARGVTEDALIRYQKNQPGASPRDSIDWANNWQHAVDEVLGSRGKLEKSAPENAEIVATVGAALARVPDDTYEHYKFLRKMGMAEAAEEEFQKTGTSVDDFERNREKLLGVFDEQLQLETYTVLEDFEGRLLLTKERLVDNKEGRKQIAFARLQAANQDEVKLPKLQSVKAERERDAANRAVQSLRRVSLTPAREDWKWRLSLLDRLKEAEETLATKRATAEEAREKYLGALQVATGVPVASWRGFDVDQFFYGESADRSANILAFYIAQKLASVERARKELKKDKKTFYKADMMVELTKKRLEVQPGSRGDKIVADWVEECSSAPWWEQLLDILSLALMFVPGAALLKAAVSIATAAVAERNRDRDEGLYDAGLRTKGGDLFNVLANAAGVPFDVSAFLKVAAPSTGFLSHADEAAKAVSETADVATAGSKAEHSAAGAAGSTAPAHPVAAPHNEGLPPAGQPPVAAAAPPPGVAPTSAAPEAPIAPKAAGEVAPAHLSVPTPTPPVKAPLPEAPVARTANAPTSQIHAPTDEAAKALSGIAEAERSVAAKAAGSAAPAHPAPHTEGLRSAGQPPVAAAAPPPGVAPATAAPQSPIPVQATGDVDRTPAGIIEPAGAREAQRERMGGQEILPAETEDDALKLVATEHQLNFYTIEVNGRQVEVEVVGGTRRRPGTVEPDFRATPDQTPPRAIPEPPRTDVDRSEEVLEEFDSKSEFVRGAPERELAYKTTAGSASVRRVASGPAETHHVASQFSRRLKKLYERAFGGPKIKVDGKSIRVIDHPVNLIKEYADHRVFPGWWTKAGDYVMRGHHPGYHDWVERNLRNALDQPGLTQVEALEAFKNMAERLKNVVQENPWVLQHGTSKLPADLQDLPF